MSDPDLPVTPRSGNAFGPFQEEQVAQAGSDLGALFHSLRELGPYDPSTLPRSILHMVKKDDPDTNELLHCLRGTEAEKTNLGLAARALEILARVEAERLGRYQLTGAFTETPRQPRRTEPQSIEIDDIVVFPKKTMIEYDRMLLQRVIPEATEADVLSRYRDRGYSEGRIARIQEAHEAHRSAVATVMRVVPKEQVFDTDDLSEEQIRDAIRKAKLVVVPSGDDHAKRVSHYVDDQYVLFINSHPGPNGSTGAHAYFTAQDFLGIPDRLKAGRFFIEDWTRIEAAVNGKALPTRALSEISVAELEHDMGSRLVVNHRGRDFQWKGSGGLVATGYGSTGWYRSATRFPGAGQEVVLPRTAPELLFCQREVYDSMSSEDLLLGALEAGEALQVHSLLKRQGVISFDAVNRVPFPYGSVLEVRASDRPLKVISDLFDEE